MQKAWAGTDRSRPKSLWLRCAIAAGAATSVSGVVNIAAAAPNVPPRVKYCLNMSTIRGHKLSITEEVDIAAEAGYRAIEPWIGKIDGVDGMF